MSVSQNTIAYALRRERYLSHNIYLCTRYYLRHNVKLLDRVKNFRVELNSKMRIINVRHKELS
jgi:hypothetical protein